MTQQATLAAGCFWCTEAIYQLVNGVEQVVSGYAGGHTDNPTYEQLHAIDTGHAEAIQISFNPDIISYQTVLEIFYYVHDPTTPNRQGNDVGEEYRSIIFYEGDEQKQTAEAVTADFAPQYWSDPIITQLVPLQRFWPAEDYHQDYFRQNPEQMYCQLVINPKLNKFKAKFESLLKD